MELSTKNSNILQNGERTIYSALFPLKGIVLNTAMSNNTDKEKTRHTNMMKERQGGNRRRKKQGPDDRKTIIWSDILTRFTVFSFTFNT